MPNKANTWIQKMDTDLRNKFAFDVVCYLLWTSGRGTWIVGHLILV